MGNATLCFLIDFVKKLAEEKIALMGNSLVNFNIL